MVPHSPSGYHVRYLLALATTLLLEVPAVLAGYRRVAPRGRTLAAALAANLATHGLLWSGWASLPGGYAARLGAAETAVLLVEAAAYRLLLGGSGVRALAVSAIANALSTLAGLGLWRILA
jgi:hypothetical protein